MDLINMNWTNYVESEKILIGEVEKKNEYEIEIEINSEVRYLPCSEGGYLVF